VAKSTRRSERFATFVDVTAFAASFGAVTAELFSWAGPTLALGTFSTVA